MSVRKVFPSAAARDYVARTYGAVEAFPRQWIVWSSMLHNWPPQNNLVPGPFHGFTLAGRRMSLVLYGFF
jgi:hypothetical protein